MSTETAEFIKDWGGWLFSLISTAIAIWQTIGKEKYKNLYKKTNIGDRKETYNAKKKGVATRTNYGDINIH